MRNFVFSLLVGAAASEDAASLIQSRKLTLTDQDEISGIYDPHQYELEEHQREIEERPQREQENELKKQRVQHGYYADHDHERENDHQQYDPYSDYEVEKREKKLILTDQGEISAAFDVLESNGMKQYILDQAGAEALLRRAGQTNLVLDTFLELPAQKQVKLVNLLQHAETKQIFHGLTPSTQRAALQLLQQGVEQSTARKGSDVTTTGAATDAVDKVVSGKTSSVTEAATDPPNPPPGSPTPVNCPDDLATGLCNIDVHVSACYDAANLPHGVGSRIQCRLEDDSTSCPSSLSTRCTLTAGSVATTEGPTTEGPTTEGPTTAGPTSAGPTTAGPTTAGPTTAGPTTEGPTTEGPTTEGPKDGDDCPADLASGLCSLSSHEGACYDPANLPEGDGAKISCLPSLSLSCPSSRMKCLLTPASVGEENTSCPAFATTLCNIKVHVGACFDPDNLPEDGTEISCLPDLATSCPSSRTTKCTLP